MIKFVRTLQNFITYQLTIYHFLHINVAFNKESEIETIFDNQHVRVCPKSQISTISSYLTLELLYHCNKQLNYQQNQGMIKVEEESSHHKFSQEYNQVEIPLIDPDEYIPSHARRNIKRQLIRRKQKSQKFNLSLWKMEENIAYMQFLIQNYSLFMKSHLDRRLMKINVLMSKAIRTRTSNQCRSHHQKMMKFHHDIPSIIEYIKGVRMNDTNSNLGQDNLQVKIEDDENYDS